MIEPDGAFDVRPCAAIADVDDPHVSFDCVGDSTPDNAARTIVVKLPAPVVGRRGSPQLAALDWQGPGRGRAGTGGTG